MKLGYTITTGICISAFALFFYEGRGEIIKFLTKETAQAQTVANDTGMVKKPVRHQRVSYRANKKATESHPASIGSSLPYYLAAPSLSAMKTVDKTTGAVSGDVLTYTVSITNSGTADATALSLLDNIDPNTTMVSGSLKTSPVALNDHYTSLGNVGITVPAANGILSNDNLGTNPVATFSGAFAPTTQGGSISINADGGFSYTPAAGFTGDDTYTYSLNNETGSSSATITITVSEMIWFVDNTAGSGGDGRLTSPFNSLASVSNGGGGSKVNQAIFVYSGSGNYTGGITLLAGQKLIGQGATATLASILGITVPSYSAALPATNGTAPVLIRTTSDAVITLANGNTVRGISTSGGTNSVLGATKAGVTLQENTFNGASAEGVLLTAHSGTSVISSNTVSSTGIGIKVTTTSGSLNLNASSNTVTSASTGILLDGSAGGTFAISDFSGNTINGNTAGTGISVASAKFDAFPGTATFEAVSGGTTTIGGAGNGVGGAGLVLSNVTGNLSFTDLDIFADGGAGLRVSSTGALNAGAGTGFGIAVGATVATIEATGGPGVDISNASISLPLASYKSTNSATTGLSLVNAFATGSTALSTSTTGHITNSSGTGVLISGGNGDISIGIPITVSTGTGVSISGRTSGNIDFSGTLTLSTGANAGFTVANASTGSSITVMGSANTISTTTATALTVTNTTIGAGGLTFRSISANGASKGISLNNTGNGSFTITGTGTTPASGGTIQNISTRGIEIISAKNISLNNIQLTNANTGDGGLAGACDEVTNGGCYAALYVSNATTVSLTQVNVTTTTEEGINLNGVSGLAISNCTVQGNGNDAEEGALNIRNLTGTCTITNSTFKNSAYRIAYLRNSAGNLHLTVDGSSFFNEASNTSSIKQDCFEMRTKSDATATVILKNSSFKRAGTKGIQVAAENTSNISLAITNCTVDREGTPMAGIEVISDQTATMNANVDGNPLISSDGEVGLNVYSGSTSTLQATARNNASIQGGNNPNFNTFANLRAAATEGSDSKVLFSGNTVSNTDEEGIQIAAYDGVNSGSVNATVDGNTLTTNNVSGNTTVNAVDVRSVAVSGTASTNCSNVKNNNVTLTTAGPLLFAVTTGTATSLISLQGTGTNTNAVDIWNNNLNQPTGTTSTVKAFETPGSIIVYGGNPCATPTNLVLPTAVASVQPEESKAIARALNVENVKTEKPSGETIAAEGDGQAAEEVKLLSSADGGAPVAENEQPVSTTNAAIQQTETPQSITVSGITLQPAQSFTVKFQVTVNNNLPSNACAISNQGSVSATGVSTIKTDNDGNSGNGINPTITTIKDVTPPVINCPGNITTDESNPGSGSADVSFSATASDICSPNATVKYYLNYGSGNQAEITSPHVFPVGETTVTAEAKDASNNTNTCSFTVTVNPLVVCQITPPADMMVPNGPNQCGAFVTYGGAGTTGGCGVLTYSPESGNFFPVGTTTVTILSASTGQTATFNVTVYDAQRPSIICPSPAPSLLLGANCSATVPDYRSLVAVSDNCTAAEALTITQVPEPGTIVTGTGPLQVTFVVKDAAGNSNSCSVDVAKMDKEPPTVKTKNIILPLGKSGTAGIMPGDVDDGSYDNCGTVTLQSVSPAIFTCANLGDNVVTLLVEDSHGNTETGQAIVTVIDNISPVITSTPADITLATDAGSCTRANVNVGMAQATDNCDVHVTGARSDGKPLRDPYPFGTTVITWTAEDQSQNSVSTTQNVNINRITTSAAVTVTPGTQQYSDLVSFRSTVTPVQCGTAPVIGGTVTFKVGTQIMGTAPVGANGVAELNNVALLEPTPYGTAPTGQMSPVTGSPVGQKTVTAEYSGTNSSYTVVNPTIKLTITPEDARADYTGSLFVATSGATSGKATVTLSATIRDITAVTNSGDANGGDIRNATVTFVNRDVVPNAIIGTAQVGLVSAGDPKVGTATLNWAVDIGSADAKQYTIGVVVGGYYTRNSSDDDAVVTVAKQLDNFVTGGGYTVLTSSTAGIKAGDVGSRNNFGFNVKFNKGGKNLQGNANVIFRKTEPDGVLHVYQIKGNNMTSLSVKTTGKTPSPANPATATFNGKASIQDITSPLNVISVDGNASLQIAMTDKGEPGTSDMIGITVWDKNNNLFFSSSWSGIRTVEQLLAAGNIRVSSSGTIGSGGPQSPAPVLTLRSSQNPSTYGEVVTFTAAITPPVGGPAMPSGQVVFTEETTTLSVVRVEKIQGKMTAIWSTASLPVGDHRIKAVYYSDPANNGGNLLNGSASQTSAVEVGASESDASDSLVQRVIDALNTQTTMPYYKIKPERLQVSAHPNPAPSAFTLVVRSNSDRPITLRVLDVWGRVVEARNHLSANSSIVVGNTYRPGVYFVEVVQAGDKVSVKLIKQSD